MRVLVTGGAGSVASLLLAHLTTMGEVTLCDRDAPTFAVPESTRYVQHEFGLDRAADHRTFAGSDVVLHLAGNADPAVGAGRFEADLRLATAILAAASLAEVDVVVVASSLHVCGLDDIQARFPISASDPPRPCCAYGACKAAIESTASLFARTQLTRCVSIRLGWVMNTPVCRRSAYQYVTPGRIVAMVGAIASSQVRLGTYLCVSNPGREWDFSPATRNLGLPAQDPLHRPQDIRDLPPAQPRRCAPFLNTHLELEKASGCAPSIPEATDAEA